MTAFNSRRTQSLMKHWVMLNCPPGSHWNHWSVENENEIEELLKSFRQIGARTSDKQHFLWLHLNYFPQELWKFEWRAGWALLPRDSHDERMLPRPVRCKLFWLLLLVLETERVVAEHRRKYLKITFIHE